jgi:hypothetical protein
VDDKRGDRKIGDIDGIEQHARASSGRLRFRDGILQHYPDVLTPEAIDALEALAGFNRERR